MPGTFDEDDVADVAGSSYLAGKTNLPYPSFSKAHSREVVGKPNIPTPDPTEPETKETGAAAADLPNGKRKTSKSNSTRVPPTRDSDGYGRGAGADGTTTTQDLKSPPSPPLTNFDQLSRKGSFNGDLSKDEKSTSAEEREKPNKHHVKTKVRIKKPRSSREANDDEPPVRSDRDSPRIKTEAKEATPPPQQPPPTSSSSRPGKTTVQAIFDQLRSHKRTSNGYGANSPSPSNATVRDSTAEAAAAVANGSRSTTPTPPQKPMTPPVNPYSRYRPRSSASYGANGIGRPPSAASNGTYGMPESSVPAPKVDYLLRLGGLDERAPRSLLAAGPQYRQHPEAPSHTLAAKVFEPFNHLLGDYQKVMAKHGSLAVATGYRSVARRLLDRLEAVFARDISSESCNCIMCEYSGMEEHPSGVSWGEILELVSGRKELPPWPPISMEPSVDPAWMVGGEEHVPMQKLDIDVPEEYREHFMRQSQKTKVAVDRWLSEQSDTATAKPLDELDDETLTFAMLTRLNRQQRLVFCTLLGIPSNTSAWAPRNERTPRVRPPVLAASSVAIERLYRLPSAPRDAETAMYMVRNPEIHHVLATIAAISDDEWDILVSGRFDGFLRSGAEDDLPLPRPGSTPPRRGTPTPSQSGSTQQSMSSSLGGPIALDEETEIMALTEIERDIFVGMEALEDAFEALHGRAELVRRALRERGAGLYAANQSRRSAYMEARSGTPVPGAQSNGFEDGMDDDFLDDGVSLCPDDSASNISSSRRRRPKRRSERRAPAPVEEENEGEEDVRPYQYPYYGYRRGFGRRR